MVLEKPSMNFHTSVGDLKIAAYISLFFCISITLGCIADLVFGGIIDYSKLPFILLQMLFMCAIALAFHLSSDVILLGNEKSKLALKRLFYALSTCYVSMLFLSLNYNPEMSMFISFFIYTVIAYFAAFALGLFLSKSKIYYNYYRLKITRMDCYNTLNRIHKVNQDDGFLETANNLYQKSLQSTAYQDVFTCMATLYEYEGIADYRKEKTPPS